MNSYIEELKKGLSLPREIVDDISTEIETHIYYQNFMNKEETIEESLGSAKELAKNINRAKIIGISEILKLKSTKKLFAYFFLFNMFWISFIVLTNMAYVFGKDYFETMVMIFLQRLSYELSMLSGLLYIISYFILYFIAVKNFKSYTQIALVTLVSSLIVFGGAIIIKYIFVFTPAYSLLTIDPMFEYAIFLISIMMPSIIIGKEYLKKAKGKDDTEMLIN